MKKIHLREYFPDFVGENSLFQKMVDQGAPWSKAQGEAMDRAYFTMYSGLKNPSEFVILNSIGEGKDAVANTITIAAILYSIYGKNWSHVWNALESEYNPIENYSMTEDGFTTHKTDNTVDRTNDLTSTVDGTVNRADNATGEEHQNGTTESHTTGKDDSTTTLQHGETIDRTADAENFTFAFNSGDGSPTSSQLETGNEQHTGTDTTTLTDSSSTDVTGTAGNDVTTKNNLISDLTSKDVRVDKEAEQTIGTEEGEEHRTLKRSGNIGVTTTQQMLQQEIELWQWNFFTQVFQDVDKYLTLPMYTSCPFNFSYPY